MLWSPTATQWRGPGDRGTDQVFWNPSGQREWGWWGRVSGGGIVSLYDQVGSPSPLGWFGRRKVWCLGRWGEAGQARGTGVSPGEGGEGQAGSR